VNCKCSAAIQSLIILTHFRRRELRIELTLPGSGLNQCGYLSLFPSPPDSFGRVSGLTAIGGRRGVHLHDGSERDDARRAETGWFFYLAEIALRHITNRAVQMNHDLLLKHTQSLPQLTGAQLQDLRHNVTSLDEQLQKW
jgi:hypothetical protein